MVPSSTGTHLSSLARWILPERNREINTLENIIIKKCHTQTDPRSTIPKVQKWGRPIIRPEMYKRQVINDIMKRNYLPAAKMLLVFPSLTATAVTGPGSPEPAPTAAQLLFFKLNCATFALELSASAIEPDATKML